MERFREKQLSRQSNKTVPIMANIILEETEVKFKDYKDLSYKETQEDNIELFVKDELVGEIEAFTDRENGNREYICLNYEMVYLDTIIKREM